MRVDILQQFLLDFQSEQLGECASTATPFGLVRLFFSQVDGRVLFDLFGEFIGLVRLFARWTGEFIEYSDF